MATKHRRKRALELAFGKPWHVVAEEWQASVLSQAEIAERWTKIVSQFAPTVQFNQKAVCRILADAKAARESVSA